MSRESGSTSNDRPILTFRAKPNGPNCPFDNDSVEFSLYPGGCVWLSGNSGLGKSTLAMSIAGLLSPHVLPKLHITTQCNWDAEIVPQERCGVVFQQTALLDDLTVAGNLCVAIQACRQSLSSVELHHKMKHLMEIVGLNYSRDCNKQVSELSGGMGRRVALALQLAQNKHVIVLDEPFTGLDYNAAMSVAKELRMLRKTQQTAFLLISHEPQIAAVVLNQDEMEQKNYVITLLPPRHDVHHVQRGIGRSNLFGTLFRHRLTDKLRDYVFYSMPLIIFAFAACGIAISMLSADLLKRLDVTDRVVAIVDQEVRPLIKMLTGEEANALTMLGVKFKVRSMIHSSMPHAKASLFALGMAKLFVLEIGPLLTALLLSGRIGGSYAGKIATMQATAQTKLLQTLGINPVVWSFVPCLLAAGIAAPILTAIGTFVALALGDWVGPHYGIGNHTFYMEQMQEAIFPSLRLRSLPLLYKVNATTSVRNIITTLPLDWRTTFSDSYFDTMIEVATYPPIYHFLKAIVFMWIIMTVAELCARLRPNLTPRGVPFVITSSVVTAGLLVIITDWAFSQLWLLRK